MTPTPPPLKLFIPVRYSGRMVRQQLLVSKVRPCTSCQAPVLWVHTNASRNMPVDAGADPDGTYHSHFATCPEARAWRRSGKGARA